MLHHQLEVQQRCDDGRNIKEPSADAETSLTESLDVSGSVVEKGLHESEDPSVLHQSDDPFTETENTTSMKNESFVKENSFPLGQTTSASEKGKQSAEKGKSRRRLSAKLFLNKTTSPAKRPAPVKRDSTPRNTRTSSDTPSKSESTTPKNVASSAKRFSTLKNKTPTLEEVFSSPKIAISASKQIAPKSINTSPKLKRLASSTKKSVSASQNLTSSKSIASKLMKGIRTSTPRSTTKNSGMNKNISVLDGPANTSPVSGKRNRSFTVELPLPLENQTSLTSLSSSVASGAGSSVATKFAKSSKVATPLRLPGISSAQSRRLSEARRLSSPRVQRVEPTYAKPVFTIGRSNSESVDAVPKAAAAGGVSKSSIPRFMAYAQKIKKMPNFKRIHDKAFDTMQNIDDFVAKKKRLLESATKAKRGSAAFVPTVTTPSKLKLDFSETPRGPNSPVVRFGTQSVDASQGSSAIPALAEKAPLKLPMPNNSAPAGSAKKVASVRRMTSMKENIKPVTPRASMSVTWGAGPGLRRASTIAPTPRSALRTNSETPSFSKQSSITVTKSHGRKTRVTETRRRSKSVDSEISFVAAAGSSNLNDTTSVVQPNAPAGSSNRSDKICKPILGGRVRSKTSVSSFTDSAAKKPIICNASAVFDKTTENTKAGIGGSKLPRYQFGAGAPASEKIRRVAGKKPPVASRAELRAEAQEFIKGVRTNKRFRLQMERRGINI